MANIKSRHTTIPPLVPATSKHAQGNAIEHHPYVITLQNVTNSWKDSIRCTLNGIFTNVGNENPFPETSFWHERDPLKKETQWPITRETFVFLNSIRYISIQDTLFFG